MLNINDITQTDKPCQWSCSADSSTGGGSKPTQHKLNTRQSRFSCLSFTHHIKGLLFALILIAGVSIPASAQFTLTLSPSKDNQLTNGSTNNNGTCSNMDSYNTGGIDRRALYQFDISALPADAVITSASLKLYSIAVGTANTTVRAHRVTSNWDEGAACAAAGASNWTQRLTAGSNWTLAGGDYDPTASATLTGVSTANQFYSFTITSLVQAWENGTVANNGLILLNDLGFLGVSWTSKEWTTVSQRPALIINYTSASTQSTFSPAVDNVISQSTPSTNYGSALNTTISGGINLIQRPIMRFDLSAIPTNATVTSAALIWIKSGGDASIVNVSAHQITNPWTETGSIWTQRQAATNWTTAGGDFNATAAATVAIGNNGTYTYSIPTLVQNWINNPATNYGLLMKQVSETSGGEKYFHSKEVTDATLRPSLIVTYTTPSGSITKSIAIGSDDVEEEGSDGVFGGPGYMYTSSPDINLIRDDQAPSSGNQKIGLRFTGLTVPKNATITNAYLTFVAQAPVSPNTNSGATSLTIRGQAADNARDRKSVV